MHSDEGLTLEMSVFESFTVANLPYRPCGWYTIVTMGWVGIDHLSFLHFFLWPGPRSMKTRDVQMFCSFLSVFILLKTELSRNNRLKTYLIRSDKGLKLGFESFTVAKIIYLIDLVVDNLFWCFTLSPMQQTVYFERWTPLSHICWNVDLKGL